MFTGIITDRGTVKSVTADHGGRALTISLPGRQLKRGESVAVNGVCLTVVARRGNIHAVYVVPETLRCTTLSSLCPGDIVNAEMALRFGQRLGGHFVLGHVDAAGVVKTLEQGRKGIMVRVGFPKKFQRLVARKGSVALDGVSLTVVDVGAAWFSVALVPYTLRHTTLGAAAKGDKVNIEFDIFARYVHASKR